MIRRSVRPLLVLLFAMTPFAEAHEAHKHATGVVAERSNLMKTVGKATRDIGRMLEGVDDYDAEALAEAAAVIERSSGERLIALFPEGSAGPTSEALPAIWQNWDHFSAYASQLAALGTVLAETAPRGNDEQQPQAISGSLGLAAPSSTLLTAAEIQDLAEGGPRPAFSKLVKTCQACHSAFREPQ